jgi:hypothetical protein
METIRNSIQWFEKRPGLRRFLFSILGFIFWKRFGFMKSLILWKEGRVFLRRVGGIVR